MSFRARGGPRGPGFYGGRGRGGGPMQRGGGGGGRPVPLMSLMMDHVEDDYRRDDTGIPKALENILRGKEVRARAMGMKSSEDPSYKLLESDVASINTRLFAAEADNESSSDDEPSQQQTLNAQKNKKKKLKKKRSKQRKREERDLKAVDERKAEVQIKEERSEVSIHDPDNGYETDKAAVEELHVEIELVPEKPDLDIRDPNYLYFAKIFEAFQIGDPEETKNSVKMEDALEHAMMDFGSRKVPKIAFNEEDFENEKKKDDDKDKISNKKRKLMMRPTVAQLKASTHRPDVVEWHDVTAKDPKLLVHLKAARNTVPVPRHWCFKRKYLAGKRGFEKPPFELPEFIRRTGIMEMRQALQEKEESKNLKSKMREKIRPKMGKIDIDYQKLHDAFFRYQTKPKNMTTFGELYYEGKELETRMKDKKPGELSDGLRTALGMPVGPNAIKFPPPWLIAMQRYGPPPSYPNLKVPGLNAPIPDGCSFGYHAGGWGKPPVDEFGRPLYGDVFGIDVHRPGVLEEHIEKHLWGEMESESEESEAESSEEESEEEQVPDESGMVTPGPEGLMTPSGMSSSMTAGLETPDTIELRKKKVQQQQQDLDGAEQSLYQVLPERKLDRVGHQMMASTHVYDISKSGQPDGAAKVPPAAPVKAGEVEVNLNPDELELDAAQMSAKYEQKLREQQLGKDVDLSDMVADHNAKQRRKRRAKEEARDGKPTTKKYKDFKF